jgi:hypothetical protein
MINLLWPPILAQTSPANSAAAIASSPSPIPTATPAPGILHTIVHHPYSFGDIVTFGILLLIVVGVGILIGLFLRKGGMEGLTKFFGDFTNLLAYIVVVLAFIGIFWLGRTVIGATTGNQDNVKYVFGAILPLLGTWVGAVLAHYFQKENLAAATQSISDLASKVAGTDRLQATLARDVMIKPDQIATLPDKYIGQKVKDVKAQASLSELVGYLKSINKDRLPLFCDSQTNEDQQTYQKNGVAAGVVHLTSINAFIQAYASLPADAGKKDSTTLSLGDLISDDKCKYKTVFDNSFGLVAEDTTLGRAKAVMENLTQKIPSGIKEGCYNIFVTKTGDAKETVLGWVTNDIINGNAKV